MHRPVFDIPFDDDHGTPVAPPPLRSSTLICLPQIVLVYSRADEAAFGNRGRKTHGNGAWDFLGYLRLAGCRAVDWLSRRCHLDVWILPCPAFPPREDWTARLVRTTRVHTCVAYLCRIRVPYLCLILVCLALSHTCTCVPREVWIAKHR